MSKSKKDESANAFGGFNVLNGGFVPPIDSEDDDITSPDDTVVKDNIDSDEAARIAEADRKLLEISEAKANKTKPSVEDTEETTEETEEDEVEETTLFRTFTKQLYEKGAIDFDDTDPDYEDSEDGVAKLVEKTANKRFEDKNKSLPDEYNKFLEFVQNGGRPRDFLNVYYGNYSWEEFPIESEENQKLAVAESLRLAGESEEDIEDIVNEWNDNGSLSKRAKSALTKLQKYEATEKAALLEQQKAEAEKQRLENKKYWDTFRDDLLKKEDIMGFKVTPKIREKLFDFMTAIDKRTGKTAYQESLENKKDAQLLFALQAMNNFDVSSLEKQVRTKVSNDMKKLLVNYSKGTKDRISGGRTDEDYGSNPFEAFKSAK